MIRDIGSRRLVSQGAAHPNAATPADVVAHLGAVQAQDYLGSLWALGLRVPGATEASVEEAIAQRMVVRTWPMRGTIHYIAPDDVRWMLELLTPRVVRGAQSRLRQLGIDETVLKQSAAVIEKALANGQLTRKALYERLDAAGISTAGQRGIHILGQLAHSQLICFGAREGKQPTFVLLDQWAPNARSLPREEALAKIALRYFTSHGPATIQDFVWWTGLTLTDARAAVNAVAGKLECEEHEGRAYYFAPNLPAFRANGEAFLLPPFDEFLVSYRDRSAALDPQYTNLVTPGSNGIFNPIVVIDGKVLGYWKREFKKDTVMMNVTPFTSFSEQQQAAIATTAEDYARFVGKTLVLQVASELGKWP